MANRFEKLNAQFPAHPTAVTREEVSRAAREALRLARTLERIENRSDLDWDEMIDLCATAAHLARFLADLEASQN